MVSKALIIPAAGAGKRMQRELPKPYLKLGAKTILGYSLSRFKKLPGLVAIVVAASVEYLELTRSILDETIPADMDQHLVEGGATRQYSIANALKTISNIDLVLVHDAVRPFVSLEHIEHCCNTAEQTGAAVLGVPSQETIKKVDKMGFVDETPKRKSLWQVQTPQVFKTNLLKKAYQEAEAHDYKGTDDASLVEFIGEPVKIVKGSSRNIKLTYPHDLEIAKLFIEQSYD